jgi:hypothetical protein
MDLALEFGLPVGMLSRLLTERELLAWNRYSRRKMLPQRRIELYLAQIARLIAVTMGGSKAPLSAFLFDPPSADTDADAVAFDEDAEFNP